MHKEGFNRYFISCIVFLSLVMAGCGAPSPVVTQSSDQGATPPGVQPTVAQAPANPKVDACTLLTKADAEKIMGNPVDEPTHPIQGSETFIVDSCEYKLTGGTALDNATLVMSIPSNGDLASAQTAFTSGKGQAQAAYNASPVDVPGLGDMAYWVGGSGNNLSILKGNVNITLSASTQKGDAPTQAILDLAKVVLGRLP